MKNKTIHIIEGNPNSGKTTTAWLVYLQLLQKGGEIEFFHLFRNGHYEIPKVSEEPLKDFATYMPDGNSKRLYDFCAIIKIYGSRIAIFSAGDNDIAINQAFKWLAELEIEVFVGCSRSHGNPSVRQELLAHEEEYRIIYHRVYSDYTMSDIDAAAKNRLPLAEDITETILNNIQKQKGDDKHIVLQSLLLKKLWNKYDIEWSLNRHINILTGDNGDGKSTLLYTLYTALRDPEEKNGIMSKSDGIDIRFTDGSLLSANFVNDKYSAFKQGAEQTESPHIAKIFNELTNQIESKYGTNKVQDMTIQVSLGYALAPDGSTMNVDTLLSTIKVDLIRTFDIFKYTEGKTSAGKDSQQSQVTSELDNLLHDALVRYAYYIGKLGDRALRIVTEGKSDETIVNIMQGKDTFLTILNSYLEESGKSIIAEQGTLRFKVADSSDIIDAYSLSSGEKQLLYTLLTVLLEEHQNYILILDEPETSLHVSWQRKLISSIKVLNPNCQIIMATHSPAIIADGYHSFVTNIEDIRSKR